VIPQSRDVLSQIRAVVRVFSFVGEHNPLLVFCFGTHFTTGGQ